MKRWLSIVFGVLFGLCAGISFAQNPIKIGMSMPQTGSLGAGGHLKGAPQTPTTARPSVNPGMTSRNRCAPATE